MRRVRLVLDKSYLAFKGLPAFRAGECLLREDECELTALRICLAPQNRRRVPDAHVPAFGQAFLESKVDFGIVNGRAVITVYPVQDGHSVPILGRKVEEP